MYSNNNNNTQYNVIAQYLMFSLTLSLFFSVLVANKEKKKQSEQSTYFHLFFSIKQTNGRSHQRESMEGKVSIPTPERSRELSYDLITILGLISNNRIFNFNNNNRKVIFIYLYVYVN